MRCKTCQKLGSHFLRVFQGQQIFKVNVMTPEGVENDSIEKGPFIIMNGSQAWAKFSKIITHLLGGLIFVHQFECVLSVRGHQFAVDCIPRRGQLLLPKNVPRASDILTKKCRNRQNLPQQKFQKPQKLDMNADWPFVAVFELQKRNEYE